MGSDVFLEQQIHLMDSRTSSVMIYPMLDNLSAEWYRTLDKFPDL